MSLQAIFYLTAIITMVLAIVILIGMVVILFYIKKTIDRIHKSVDDQIAKVKRLTSDPAEIARGSGAVLGKAASAAVSAAVSKLRKKQ